MDMSGNKRKSKPADDRKPMAKLLRELVVVVDGAVSRPLDTAAKEQAERLCEQAARALLSAKPRAAEFVHAEPPNDPDMPGWKMLGGSTYAPKLTGEAAAIAEQFRRAAMAICLPPATGEWGRKRVELLSIADGLEGNPSATPGAVVKHPPSCTSDHNNVLILYRSNPGACIPVTKATGGVIRNRETLGRLFVELGAMGMVHRPHGERKGYALTEAGRKELAALVALGRH